MRYLTLMLFLLLFFIHYAALADWSLQINGRSFHVGGDDPTLNENNRGLGIYYDWDSQGTANSNFATAGTLINSRNDRSWYAGAGKMWRIGSERLHLDTGFIAGLATYPSREMSLQPIVLPAISLGSDRLSLDAYYIPAIGSDNIHAFLLQLRVGIP